MITGNTLISLGYEPARWFGEVIKYANSYNLERSELIAYIETIKPKVVFPHTEPLPYYKNIRAESEAEQLNINKVFETMNELMKTPTVRYGAIMPDACPTGEAGQMPVGGIIATENAIHPSMHSADICCSVMMTNYGYIDPKTVLDTAHSVTHFGIGCREDLINLPVNLEAKIKNNKFLSNEKSLFLAKNQLGTQGDGNHFLYVGQSEKTGETIVVTHHGSRGFGATLFNYGMKLAEYYRKQISPQTLKINAWIPYDTEEGKIYWEALQIVREWTKLNHSVIHDATSQRMKKEPVSRFWNEHNFVFKDKNLFYHAKGATPLAEKFVPDSRNGLRLIPLNMSEPVLIVKGEETPQNLGFAPHGAGRNISRSQFKRNNSHKTNEEIFDEETQGLDVRFFSNNIDTSELPSAYKKADTVQAQMNEFGLGKVVDKVLPYGCIMAGDWKKDAPWKKNKKK